MAARNDQQTWWTGKSEAEIIERMRRDEDDFFAGRNNYASDTNRYDDVMLDETYLAPQSTDVLDSLCEETAEAETNADIAAVALEALRALDASDKRSSYVETLTALTVTKANLDTGKHNMSDLAKVLGVSRPTAIGRYRNLMRVLDELRA